MSLMIRLRCFVGSSSAAATRLRLLDAALSCATKTTRRTNVTTSPGIRVAVHPSGHDSSGENSRINRRNKNKNPSGAGKHKATSRHRKQRGQSSYKFVDRARIRVAGGAGGNGSVSNKHLGRYKKRPDGGHGGDGGAVILVADANEQTLAMSIHHHSGEDGKAGGSQAMNGRNGRNKIVRVPCGVIVRRVLDYDEVWDEEEGVVRKIVAESTSYEEGDEEANNDERALFYNMNDTTSIDHGQVTDTKSEGNDMAGSIGDDICDIEEEYFSESDESEEEEEEYFSDSGGNDEDEEDIAIDDEYWYSSDNVDNEEQNDQEEVDDVELVNTGIKATDGMYHWCPEGNNQNGEDEWVSSSADMNNYEREKVVIADLDKPGSFVVLATGGRGGTGSSAYAKKQWTPDLMANASERRVGQPGESAHLELELKLIADLGLVGFPNAGKSSLLASMSMARPEIAPYPFTTLHPLVGTIRYRDGFRVVAADVPGLVAGAAHGRGRGHDFLRHLERTKTLLYIVDAAGVDGRDPIQDLHVLAEEIGSYGDGDMMSRRALLVANKMDLIPEEQERESLLFDLALAAEEAGIDYHEEVLGISAGVTGEGLGLLSKAMRRVVTEGEANRIMCEAASN